MKTDPLSAPNRTGFLASAQLLRLSACCLLTFFALGRIGSAIPQTFSQPTQITLRTGKPVEEFFRDPATWAPGAEIPGEASDTAGKESSALAEPGAVFGVNASAIRLVRAANGELQATVVTYDAKTAGATPQKLHERLAANIAAFAGAHGVTAQGKIRFATHELVIVLPHDAAQSLEVRITRSDSSPPARTAAQH